MHCGGDLLQILSGHQFEDWAGNTFITPIQLFYQRILSILSNGHQCHCPRRDTQNSSITQNKRISNVCVRVIIRVMDRPARGIARQTTRWLPAARHKDRDERPCLCWTLLSWFNLSSPKALNYSVTFQPLEVVDRGSDARSQVTENFRKITWVS